MRRILINLLIFCFTAKAFPVKLDSVSSTVKERRGINWLRFGVVSGVTVGFGVLSYDYFNKVWWSGVKVKRLTIKDDWDAYLLADEFGHFYSGFLIADIYRKLFQWSGFSGKVSALAGAGISIIYEVFAVEFTDGFTTRWGFSPSDAIMDLLGAGFPVAQEFLPELKNFTFKWSYTPSGYTWGDYIRLKSLKDALYKKQFHTDYEGMTFWLSIDFQKYLPEKIEKLIPDFIQIAVGYGVMNINSRKMRKHEIFIALDFDLLKVNTGVKVLDSIIHTLNYIHLPAPTLRIKPKLQFYLAYF